MRPQPIEIEDAETLVKETEGTPAGRVRHTPGVVETIEGYLRLCCYYYPVACTGLGFMVVAFVMLLLASVLFNPVEEFGETHIGFIKSKYDLSLSKIDHWCLDGGDDSCDCEDPLDPISRMQYPDWTNSFMLNKKMVQAAVDSGKQFSVAFLGASDVELMNGRWMGKKDNGEYKQLEDMFSKKFNKTNGSSFDGIALGSAGDTAPNVLYRILHGEMPDEFNPLVWWLILGSNDLARMGCSEDVVLLGVLRVVEEILEKKPDAQIVINSLLPSISSRGAEYPTEADAEDFFRDSGNRALRELLSAQEREQRMADRQKAKADALAKKQAEAAKKKADAREKKNPNLDEKAEQRKYGAGFIKKKQIPYWTSIKGINAALESFASVTDRVTFFDATPIFTEKKGKNLILSSSKISNEGHPTVKGFNLWESAMMGVLQPLVEASTVKEASKASSPPASEIGWGADDYYGYVRPVNGFATDDYDLYWLYGENDGDDYYR